jgi:hypothetical protein
MGDLSLGDGRTEGSDTLERVPGIVYIGRTVATASEPFAIRSHSSS